MLGWLSISFAGGPISAHSTRGEALRKAVHSEHIPLSHPTAQRDTATGDGVIRMPARNVAGSPVPHPQLPAHAPAALSSAQRPDLLKNHRQRESLGSATRSALQWPTSGLSPPSRPLWSLQDPASCDGYFANGYSIRDEVLPVDVSPKLDAVQAYMRAAGSVAGHTAHPTSGRGSHEMQAKQAMQLLRGRGKDAKDSAAAYGAPHAQKGPALAGEGPPLECMHHPHHPSSYCILQHVALRPDLVRLSRGNESIDAVRGRPDADELPVYQPGAFQVLVGAGGGSTNPSLQASQLSSVPLTQSQQRAFSKVRGTLRASVFLSCLIVMPSRPCTGESTEPRPAAVRDNDRSAAALQRVLSRHHTAHITGGVRQLVPRHH